MHRQAHRHPSERLLGRAAGALLAAIMVLASAACAPGTGGAGGATTQQPQSLVLASTTSTQDSGLFDVLIPAFEKASPAYSVKVIAVGTGEALKLGEQKDADVLLVHAKSDEEKFVADGFGEMRKDVMYNDFLVVGPADDPAGIKGSNDVTATMKAIHTAGRSGKAVFVSRADDSGTHKRELKLWKAADIEPAGDWYAKTGQGMGETLKVASEKKGYTLTDRATYLSMKDTLELEILLEKQPPLLNQYGVIVVTGAKNRAAARTFSDWVTGPEGQKVIGEFGVDEYGEQLFMPNASR